MSQNQSAGEHTSDRRIWEIMGQVGDEVNEALLTHEEAWSIAYTGATLAIEASPDLDDEQLLDLVSILAISAARGERLGEE